MSTDDAEIGLVSPTPRWTIPYSVSMPTTFWMATTARYPDVSPTGSQRPGSRCHSGPTRPRMAPRTGEATSEAGSEVLAGSHPLDGAAAGGLLVLPFAEQDPQEDDALALLAGDLGPVVGVGGVGQVLVLLVLLPDGLEQVVGADAATLAGDLALDRELLGPADDVLDHGPGREVLEVHDLLVTVLVGDLDELVLVVGPVHVLDGRLDHGPHGLVGIAAAQGLDLLAVQRQVGLE